MNKERNSNFELLRIVSMCGIIAIHYLSKDLGGMLGNASFPDFTWFFSHCIYSFACPLVNCFVLITGYFLIEKNSFCLRKPIDLMCITAFYGIIGYSIGIGIGGTELSIKKLLYSIIPFFEGKRWFVETYIILICLAPFINKCLRGLDKKNYQILLTIQIAFFSVWYSVGLSSPILDDGYGIINFITLYMFGAYYRLYGSGTLLINMSKGKLMTGYVICSLVTFCLSYFMYPFGYAFVTNILAALFSFVFFMKLHLGRNKIINTISETVFDVYFVHSDIHTSKLLMYEILQGKLVIGSIWAVPHLILVIGVMYLLGMIAFKVRTILFSVSINKLLDKSKLINMSRTI